MRGDDKKGRKLSIWAWCLYDAGNSAFSTVIVTFVFSVYFARGLIGDETQGSALWAYAMGVSGLIVALASPLVGAVTDHYGARKPGLLLFSILCIIATALLYFAAPGSSATGVALVLGLVILANTALEIALVFANAMLPHIAPSGMVGRVSGWAWGLGYIGGLACLVLVLLGLVGVSGHAPLLSLPQAHSEHIRASAPLTALWFALLTVPLALWTHDTARTGLSLGQATQKGLEQLKSTLQTALHQKNLLLFLIASALYRDGLNTLFAVGGLYAAGTFGMDFSEIMIFAIGLNVTAGLGAALFAFADDHWGSKPTVMVSLAGLIVTGAIILFLQDKTAFMIVALLLGIFMGPAQAAGRTLAARLSPRGTTAQTYGLYSLTGKVTAFLGPTLFGLMTSAFDSQRAGMASILLFWLAGMALMARVKERS